MIARIEARQRAATSTAAPTTTTTTTTTTTRAPSACEIERDSLIASNPDNRHIPTCMIDDGAYKVSKARTKADLVNFESPINMRLAVSPTVSTLMVTRWRIPCAMRHGSRTVPVSTNAGNCASKMLILSTSLTFLRVHGLFHNEIQMNANALTHVWFNFTLML